MICIIDTGIRNSKSIQNMLSKLSYYSIITTILVEITKAVKIIFPSVGAFDESIKQWRKNKLDILIKDMAQSIRIKILGVCLGMQMLGDSSEEGINAVLGLISGRVYKFTKHTIGICQRSCRVF